MSCWCLKEWLHCQFVSCFLSQRLLGRVVCSLVVTDHRRNSWSRAMLALFICSIHTRAPSVPIIPTINNANLALISPLTISFFNIFFFIPENQFLNYYWDFHEKNLQCHVKVGNLNSWKMEASRTCFCGNNSPSFSNITSHILVNN